MPTLLPTVQSPPGSACPAEGQRLQQLFGLGSTERGSKGHPKNPGGVGSQSWPGECGINVPLHESADPGAAPGCSRTCKGSITSLYLLHWREAVTNTAALWGHSDHHSPVPGTCPPKNHSQHGMCRGEPEPWVKQHSKARAEGSGGKRARLRHVPGLKSSLQ